METQNADDRKTKLLRIAPEIFRWFEAEAKRQRRSVNAEMEMALEYLMKLKQGETS